MKVLIMLMMAASLFACSAKVDAPDINWAPADDTPLNPTSSLELYITKGTTSNFNKFKLQTTGSTYEVKFSYRPTAAASLIYDNEVRQTEGCDMFSYDSVFEWHELTSTGAVLTVTPVKFGESYNVKKDVNYEFVVKLSKMSCSSVRHSFIMNLK